MTADTGGTKPVKAYLEPEKGDTIECRFNPEKLSVSLANDWGGNSRKDKDGKETDAVVPGRQAPDLAFGGGRSGAMNGLELFFDTTDRGVSVTEDTDKLIGLMKIDPTLPGHDDSKHNGRPPWVRFHWGRFHSFRSVIESLDLTFTYFSQEGVPLRARATMTLKQYTNEDEWPRQNPTSGTPTPARSHVVQPGETLDRIAATHYDDPTAWRELAAANGVKDPFALRPGALVDVPTLED